MKIICFWLGVIASTIEALPLTMPANPNSYTQVNADGSVTPPMRLIGGGESGGYDSTAEVTEDGYTVSKIQGAYMYMEHDAQLNALVSSGLQAGKENPKTSKSKRTGKKIGRNEHAKAKSKVNTKNERSLIAQIEEANGIPNEHSHVARRRTAVVGNKKNLMIAFKFSDHTTRTVPSTADLTVLMNNQGPDAALCPSGSVRDAYLASSFNQLVLDTTVAPWVTLSNTEAYYGAGNSGMSTTIHLAIADALNKLQATGFDFTPFDTDNDGYIDAIGFLHSGYGAEWGGSDSYGTAYGNRIWSHKWAVYSPPGGQWTSTSGKSVYNYHISPSVWGTSGSAIGRIGVIAHETGHFFGLPDLYDGSVGSGIGSYCMMANSWGFDGSQWYPPHFSAWSKIQLGWVTPIVITTSGTYSARQACNNPDLFLINTNFETGEYLLIENRQKCQFDAKIAGPGLAIFHIDDSASYTAEGYPGQTGWPTNGQHYRVSLLQADGNYNLEKGNNRGDSTDLFFGGGVSAITSAGTSAGLAYPNTKGYKGGVIKDTGVSITSISPSSSTMTFNVNFGPLSPTAAPTMPPANRFNLLMLTDSYASIDTAWTLNQISPVQAQIASKAIGAYGNSLSYNENYILAGGIYQFNLTDAYGDGLISPAYYTISLGGVVLKNGGAFTFLDSTTFTVGGVTPATSKPITSKPISAKPITAKPITAKPITAKPVTAKPITAKPVTAKPITAKPITAKPVTQPIAPKPVVAPVKPVKPIVAPVNPVKPAPAKPVKPAVSPVVVSAASTQNVCGSIQEGVDFSGNDIGVTATSADAEGCCGICAKQIGCGAFTWSNGICNLKSGKGATTSMPGSRSAVLGASYCAAITAGVNYSGNDISSAASLSPDGCCGICKNTAGCKAFTWLSSTNSCFLKTAKTSGTADSGAVSGTIW
eukprot:CAMPEP_0172413874 /NCGR_PEP_ID=MMETSP1064-20121228/436_1 /TAXON_ID=202472 /ORGANISM="Aulacoseira subarctica , Strain CCAP 1002/5" /LENGTH=926 /DNA_ID=CAMNT_0013150261 /DNA_START=29 /DNA_END=2806 /DNA_ORIENTATION=-